MPTHLASLDSLVHPHQMEVQEFASYALVIDARSAEAYPEDHLPGAVNVPVAADRLAGVQFTSMDRGIAAVAEGGPARAGAAERNLGRSWAERGIVLVGWLWGKILR